MPGVASDDRPTQSIENASAAEIELRSDDGTPNGTATVSLGTDAENVAGYEVNVSFDPSVIQFENASGGELPDPVTNANNEDGWVYLTSSNPNGEDAPTLAQLRFEAVGDVDDESRLQFLERDTLINDGELEIYEASDGDLATDSTTVRISERTTEQSANQQGTPQQNTHADEEGGSTPASETTVRSVSPTGEPTTTPGGNSNGETGAEQSTVLSALPAFGAGAVSIVLLGAIVYLGRRVRG
jgi:hypothetical protein